MSNTLNLGDGNWGVKDSSLLGHAPDGSKFLPRTFDVTRASSGTRVNSSGLIETPFEIVGGELILNGDFSNGLTNWGSSDGSVTIVDGGALFTIGGSNNRLYQDIGMQQDSRYQSTYTVTENIGGVQLRVYDGAGYFNVDSTVGTHTVIHKKIGSTSSIYYFNPTGGTSITIDNVSVVEVTQDNLARIDYTDGVEGVLLTEPQSTNLLPYSENFSDSSWSKLGASVTSGFASPSADNPLGAFKLVEGTITYPHKINSSTVTTSVGVNSMSIYVKKGEISKIGLKESKETGKYASFDLVSLTVLDSSVGAETEIISLNDGWIRLSIAITIAGTSISFSTHLLQNSYTSGDPNQSYTGDGTSGVYIFGAQLEALSYATSYIPTSGIIETRIGDVVTNGGDVSNFNSEEGVLFAEIAALSDESAYRVISLNDGSSTNALRIGYSSDATNTLFMEFIVGGVAQSSDWYDVDVTLSHKIAVKWKINDIAIWLDGTEIHTDTSASVPSADTLNQLSFNNGNNLPFYGKTKNIQVFNEALTDAELITLTSL